MYYMIFPSNLQPHFPLILIYIFIEFSLDKPILFKLPKGNMTVLFQTQEEHGIHSHPRTQSYVEHIVAMLLTKHTSARKARCAPTLECSRA